jgi:hypothetical protein
LAFGVEQVTQRQQIGREQALKQIANVDRARKTWCRFVYAVSPLDPSLYDLAINFRRADGRRPGGGGAEAWQVCHDRGGTQRHGRTAPGQQVKAVLAAEKEAASANVAVQAEAETLLLRGKLVNGSQVEAGLKTAVTVEGVESINRAGLDAPRFMV